MYVQCNDYWLRSYLPHQGAICECSECVIVSDGSTQRALYETRLTLSSSEDLKLWNTASLCCGQCFIPVVPARARQQLNIKSSPSPSHSACISMYSVWCIDECTPHTFYSSAWVWHSDLSYTLTPLLLKGVHSWLLCSFISAQNRDLCMPRSIAANESAEMELPVLLAYPTK